MDSGYEENKRQKTISAGERALSSLKKAADELDRAKNWGIWDILGGGMISTYVKRSKMDQAQYYLNEAKKDLQLFCKELQELNPAADLNVQTSGFLTFADYFLDGFLADLFVQDKINQTRNQVSDAYNKISDILKCLRA